MRKNYKYELNSGKILVEDNGLNDFNLDTYREKIGYVAQETQLFDLSIKDNLLWSNPNASFEDIINACKIANIYDYIKPKKFETFLGDKTVRITGGKNKD